MKERQTRVISAQSQLACGYVGNNIAQLILQLQGVEVMAVPTVIYSNHTGHEKVYGEKVPRPLFDDLLKGVEELGCFGDVGYLISGYIGSDEIVDSVAALAGRLKGANPRCRYVFDPVMGDRGCGLFVDPALAAHMLTTLLPLCDVLTPNHFELEHILGERVDDIGTLESRVAGHPLLRDKTVIVKSCILDDLPDDSLLETIILEGGRTTRVPSRRVDIITVGTGDLFCGALVGRLVKGDSVANGVSRVADYISSLLERVRAGGSREIDLAAVLASLGKLND